MLFFPMRRNETNQKFTFCETRSQFHSPKLYCGFFDLATLLKKHGKDMDLTASFWEYLHFILAYLILLAIINFEWLDYNATTALLLF